MRALRPLTIVLCVAFGVEFACAAVPVVESVPSSGVSAPPPSSTAEAPPSSSSSSGVRSYGTEQPQVVASDAVRATPPSTPVGAPSGGASGGTNAITMFQQVQQLQDEVADLRGLVEEQAHQIEKLRADQQEQYVDLDRRMTALRGGAAPAGGGENGPAPQAGTSGGNTIVDGAPASPGPANSERDAYTRAFDLTKNKRFNEAIAAFNQMLVTYPNGEYAGNAYYWLGELYRATGAPDKARQSFAQVVNRFPSNPKVSDAMYKLGVVYNELGDRTKALDYLKRVQSQFPGTQAASLAQAYAAELKQ